MNLFPSIPGVAPSFSTQNLSKSVSTQNECTSKLISILTKYSQEQVEFDIAEFMTNFTFDFLTTNMFGISTNAFHDHIIEPNDTQNSSLPNSCPKELSKGRKFMKELSIAMTEMGRRIVFPLRNYMFWDKNVHRANEATAYLMEFAHFVLDTYKALKSAEEISSDPSIMGHLMRM
jgi:hypothetical protein